MQRHDDTATEQPAIVGFRSALFGMDESALRRAIHQDFVMAGPAVGRWRNDLEQTTLLSVEVDQLIVGAGPAVVSYVLGRSGRLIQITILWGTGPDSTGAESLDATAALLIGLFNEQGHVSQSGDTPMVFADGSNLLYYARDSAGAGLALSALPRRAPDAPAGGAAILRLAYVADIANPDVYRAPAIQQ